MMSANPYIVESTTQSSDQDTVMTQSNNIDATAEVTVIGLLDLLQNPEKALPSETKGLKVVPQRLFFLGRRTPYTYPNSLTSTLSQFKNLVSLDMSRVRDFSDDDVRMIVNTHLHLQEFAFEGCPKITKAAIGSISCGKCTGLKSLSFSVPDLTSALLIICVSSQKKLKRLHIPDYGMAGEAQWESLVQKRPGLVVSYLPTISDLSSDIQKSFDGKVSVSHVKQILCLSNGHAKFKLAVPGTSAHIKEIEYLNDMSAFAAAIVTNQLDALDSILPGMDQESVQNVLIEVIQVMGLSQFVKGAWTPFLKKLVQFGFDLNFDMIVSSKDLTDVPHIAPSLTSLQNDTNLSLRLVHLLFCQPDVAQEFESLKLSTEAKIVSWPSSNEVAHFEKESGKLSLCASSSPEEGEILKQAPVDLNDPDMTGEKLSSYLTSVEWTKDTFSSLLHVWSNHKGNSNIWKYTDDNKNTLLHLMCQLRDPYLNSAEGYPLLQSFLTLAIGVEHPESVSAKNKAGRTPLGEALMSNAVNCISFLWSVPNLPQVRMDSEMVFACAEHQSEKLINSLFQSVDIHQKFDDKEAEKAFPGIGIVSCELIHFLTRDRWALEQLLALPGSDINTKALIKDPVTADASSLTVLEFALATDAPRETIKFLFTQQGTARKSFIIVWAQKQLKKLADLKVQKERDALAVAMEDLLFILPQQVVANLAPKFDANRRFLHGLVECNLASTSLFSRLVQANADLSLVDDKGETVFHILARKRDVDNLIRCMKTISSKVPISISNQSLENFVHILIGHLMEEPDRIDKDLFTDFIHELKRLDVIPLLTKPDAFDMDPITISIAATIIKSNTFDWEFHWVTEKMIEAVKKRMKPDQAPVTTYKRTSLHGLCVSFPSLLVTLGPNRGVFNVPYQTWDRLFKLVSSNQWYVDVKILDSFSRAALDYVFDPIGEADAVQEIKNHIHYKQLKASLINYGFQKTKPVPKIDDVFGTIAKGDFSAHLLAYLGRHESVAYDTDNNNRVPAHYFSVYVGPDIFESSKESQKWLSRLGYNSEKQMPFEPVDRWGWTPFGLSILKDVFKASMSSLSDYEYYEGYKSQLTLEFSRCSPRLDISRDTTKGRTCLFRLFEQVTIVDYENSEHMNLKTMKITATIDRFEQIILALVDVGRLDVNAVDQSGESVLDYVQTFKREFSNSEFKRIERLLKRLGARTGEELFYSKSIKKESSSTSVDPKDGRRSSIVSVTKKDTWTPVEPSDDLRSQLESKADTRSSTSDKKRSHSSTVGPDSPGTPPSKASRIEGSSSSNDSKSVTSKAQESRSKIARQDHVSPAASPSPSSGQFRSRSRTSTPLPPLESSSRQRPQSSSGSPPSHGSGTVTKRSIFSETLDARNAEEAGKQYPFSHQPSYNAYPVTAPVYVNNGHPQVTGMMDQAMAVDAYGYFQQGVSMVDAELFRQCELRNETEIVALVRGGASLTAQNEHLRMPLHVWCASTADAGRNTSNMIRTAEMLFDPARASLVLNHLDRSLMTPLSMMLLSDIHQWLQSAGRRWKSPTYSNVVVNPSPLTRFLLDNGATLNICASDTSETAWHGLAHMMFSDAVIPGFPQKDLEARHVYLILKQFIQFGSLNVHIRDRAGRSGLDVFRMRFESKTLQLTEGEFRSVLDDLALINC